MNTKKFIYITFFFTLLCVYSIILIYNCYDTDMFWLIADGREILKRGILYQNPTSILETSIINQQWLYCVLLALVDKCGYIGFILFIFVQNVILVLVSYSYLKRTTSKTYALFIPIVLIIGTAVYSINVRPQVVTMILLVWHLLIFEKAKTNVKYLFYIIPIIILEVNLHGSVVLYHCLIGIPFIWKDKKLNWPVVASIFAIPILALVNPYGIHGFSYIFRIFDSNFVYANRYITELQAISIFSIEHIITLVCMLSIIVLTYFKKVNLKIAVYSIIILLCLSKARYLTIIYLPALCIFEQLYEFNIFDVIKRKMTIVLGIVVMFCTACVFITKPINYFEQSTVKEVKEAYELSDPSKNLYVEFMSGGVAKYYGFEKVFFDARPEIYFEHDVFKSVILGMYGQLDGEAYSLEEIDKWMEKYNFDYLLCYNTSMMKRVCDNFDKYELIFEKEVYSFYKVLR